MARMAIVTATLDAVREPIASCIQSWIVNAAQPIDVYIVEQTHGTRAWSLIAGSVYGLGVPDILGVVPAFALGVQKALQDGAPIIACLHDDLLIEQDGWDEDVVRLFKACPRAGLLGFGGGKGLGDPNIYQTAYNPMQLARQGFRSNMRDAEAHGIRSLSAEPVACLDGFSQIGLADFWRGIPRSLNVGEGYRTVNQNILQEMADWGVVHHFYDGMLGCFAKRLGYQTWFLPIACHHYGGVTAVGDPRYHTWADAQLPAGGYGSGLLLTGDQRFWEHAHQIGYEQFRDVLPIRT